MKTRTWILLIGGLLLVLIAAAAAVMGGEAAGRVANIYQDGVCVRSVDLSGVTERYSFPINDGDGHENIVEVEPGRIRVVSANCPDGVCVQTGWISDSARPIVCLPARLVIRLEEAPGDLDIDAVAG